MLRPKPTSLWQCSSRAGGASDGICPGGHKLVAGTGAGGLSDGDALSTLLGAEGFLFAAITLAVTLSSPNQPRPQRHPRIKPEVVLLWAVTLLGVVALGAVATWCRLYVHVNGTYQGFGTLVIAATLLAAVLGQPVVALLLTLAARRK